METEQFISRLNTSCLKSESSCFRKDKMIQLNKLYNSEIDLEMINSIITQYLEQLDGDDKLKIDKQFNIFTDYLNNSKFYIINNGNMVLPDLSIVDILSLINDVELYYNFIKGNVGGSQISNLLFALARSSVNSTTVHFEMESTWDQYTVNMNEETAFKIINNMIEPFIKSIISLMNDIHNSNKSFDVNTILNDLLTKIFTAYEQSMTEHISHDQLCEGLAEYKCIMHFLNMLYDLPESKRGVCSISYEQLKKLNGCLNKLKQPETVVDQLLNEKILESDIHDNCKNDGYYVHFDSINSKTNNTNESKFKIDVNYKVKLIRIKSLFNEIESLTQLSKDSNNSDESILHLINDRLNELNSLVSNQLLKFHYELQNYVEYKKDVITLIDKVLDSNSITKQINEELMSKLFQLNMILKIKS